MRAIKDQIIIIHKNGINHMQGNRRKMLLKLGKKYARHHAYIPKEGILHIDTTSSQYHPFLPVINIRKMYFLKPREIIGSIGTFKNKL